MSFYNDLKYSRILFILYEKFLKKNYVEKIINFMKVFLDIFKLFLIFIIVIRLGDRYLIVNYEFVFFMNI